MGSDDGRTVLCASDGDRTLAAPLPELPGPAGCTAAAAADSPSPGAPRSQSAGPQDGTVGVGIVGQL
eukprot:472756-Hanusia_phi.AAC.1